MLQKSPAFSGFAVDDIEAAKTFYGDTLGLNVTEDEMGLLVLHLGTGADVIIYPKPNHVPAKFTLLNFPVDDIDTAVDELSARGVRFERYAEFDLTRRASLAARGRTSPGSATRPATSCRCCRRARSAGRASSTAGGTPS